MTVIKFPVSIHRDLKSLTVRSTFGGGADLLQYLVLPALQHLDISETYDHDSLDSFLEQSSPPLVSLSLRGNRTCLEYWDQYIPRVPSLESLEIRHVSEYSPFGLFRPFSEPQPLPKLRNLSFTLVEGPLPLEALAHVLYRRFLQLRTVKVVWTSSPFLDYRVWAGSPDTRGMDTIIGHLSRLSQGMDIHLGTANKNFISSGDPTV